MRLSDISHAVQAYVEKDGFSVVRDFVGHGVGLDIIERPFISLDDETVLKPGMVVAIHPVLTPHPEFFEACADMFVVTDGKPYRLSKVSPEIKII